MSHPTSATGLRRWLFSSLKVALAVAGLTALAQWVSPMVGERGRSIAANNVADPAMTGSLRAKPAAAAPATSSAELDRRGLLSLVSRSQGDAPRPAAPKAR